MKKQAVIVKEYCMGIKDYQQFVLKGWKNGNCKKTDNLFSGIGPFGLFSAISRRGADGDGVYLSGATLRL